MKTRIYEGKKINGGKYWQGQMQITTGRLKGSWINVTIKYSTEIDAFMDLNDFIKSTKEDL